MGTDYIFQWQLLEVNRSLVIDESEKETIQIQVALRQGSKQRRTQITGIELRRKDQELAQSGPEVKKLFSCSTQLSMKFFLLIYVKIPTVVGILTFMSGKNSILGLSEPKNAEFLDIFILMNI